MSSLSALPSVRLAKGRATAGLDATLQRFIDIRRFLKTVESLGKRWAIVGGAPRQWALGDFGSVRDLDIAIGMPPAMLERVVLDWQWDNRESVSISDTGLGGYRLSSEAWVLDIWAVAKTVGVANQQVIDTKSFRAVARSAALSLDSIVVTSKGTVYENGFFATVHTGILRMNHCSIERPQKIAEKAIRLCERFQVVPDISVQSLIASFLGTDTLRSLLRSRPFAQDRR